MSIDYLQRFYLYSFFFVCHGTDYPLNKTIKCLRAKCKIVRIFVYSLFASSIQAPFIFILNQCSGWI